MNSDALRDIPFEAAYLRAALLVGLHHERDVPVWAVECISRAPQLAAPLSEVLVARTERSAMREALRELADAAPPNRVEPALIATIALNPPESARSLHDRIRILSHIRREFTLPITIAIAIKALDERRMLADAGLRGTMAPDADEFARWIHIVRRPVHFRFGFENEEEAAAFIAALSRLVTRDRLWDSLPTRPTARAWLLREPVARGCCVLLERDRVAHRGDGVRTTAGEQQHPLSGGGAAGAGRDRRTDNRPAWLGSGQGDDGGAHRTAIAGSRLTPV